MKSKFPNPLISIDGVLSDKDGSMVQVSVPKKFHPILPEGYVYMFTDIAAVDVQNKSHIYHHQNYMLQFKQSTKVHQLETRGADIPKFSFNFCPFDKLPENDTFAKPLHVNKHEIRLWGQHGETFDEGAVLKKSE
ncbi:hypothetical protein BS78_10G103900 [Paspalum vaginatum]|nr:hypothetical protein BS78_10G103900 [Paspalum vaginatum]